jgi:hypothetical protein
MDFLSPYELAQMTSDAADLVGDAEVGLAATYRKFVSTVFTPSTGLSVPSYTDYAVDLIRNDLSAGEVRASNGLYQIGDVRFTIARALLTPVPGKEDLVVLGGDTYNVVHWSSDPIGLLWRLVGRLVS